MADPPPAGPGPPDPMPPPDAGAPVVPEPDALGRLEKAVGRFEALVPVFRGAAKDVLAAIGPVEKKVDGLGNFLVPFLIFSLIQTILLIALAIKVFRQ